jgi:flagellar hook-basal body complex protein FliE
MKLVVRAGLRERKDTREKINALIDAQLRTEDAMARLSQKQERTEEAMARLTQGHARTEDVMARLAQGQSSLAQSQANTDERLSAFISTVERLIKERRNGNP